MAYESINPYTAERVKKFVEHTDAEVEIAITKAQACFTAWKETTFAERSAILSIMLQFLSSDIAFFLPPDATRAIFTHCRSR